MQHDLWIVPLTYLWLLPLGFFVGAYGTMIGAGGGFILVPLLLLFYPKDAPEIITSISLAVVFFNAASGSIAYARMKRIDFKSGTIFSLAAIPGVPSFSCRTRSFRIDTLPTIFLIITHAFNDGRDPFRRVRARLAACA